MLDCGTNQKERRSQEQEASAPRSAKLVDGTVGHGAASEDDARGDGG